MFEEMVVSSPHPTKTKKPITVLLSAVFQLVFLGILILIPLIYTEALPKTMMATMLTAPPPPPPPRSEEHTSELQSQSNLVCRLLLEKKKNNRFPYTSRPSPRRAATPPER